MSKQPVYFTVTGDFRAIVGYEPTTRAEYDGVAVPISGTVTFTPVLNTGDVIRATTAEPRPTGFLPTPITAVIDPVDGRVKMQSQLRSTGDGPLVPVRLLADTPLLELGSPLYYQVSFSNIKYGSASRQGTISGFTFQAPKGDSEVNLITVMRQPGQPAVGSGVLNVPQLEVHEPADDTGVVVVDNGVVKLSPWSAFKSVVVRMVQDWFRAGSDAVFNTPFVQHDPSGVPVVGPLISPSGSLTLIDNRAFQPGGHPYTAVGQPHPVSLSYDSDTTTRFRVRARKDLVSILANRIDDMALPGNLLLSAQGGGGVFVGTGPNLSDCVPANRVVTAGNIVSLSNKTLVSPTITGTPTVNGGNLASQVPVPATATATGTPGQWATDNTHLYVCTATNTWRRTTLQTW